MKTKTIHIGFIPLACFVLFLSSFDFALPVQAQTYQLRSQGDLPLPFDPYEGAEPVITLDASRQIYRVQDNTNDWNLLTTAKELDAMSANEAMVLDSPPDPTNPTNDSSGGTYTNNVQPHFLLGSNDLWIELTQVNTENQQAFLTLHGTLPGDHYQLLSTNMLGKDGQIWALGQLFDGAPDTNQTDLSAFYVGTNTQMFFRAHHTNAGVYVTSEQNAIEPNSGTGDPGQTGSFAIHSYYSLDHEVTVHYQLGGTAQNGIDYSNLSGVVTLSPDNTDTNIDIVPLQDNLVEGDETVTLSIQQTNDYLIDPTRSSARILIEDSSTLVGVYPDLPDAIEPDGPPGAPAQIGTFAFSRSDNERNLYPAMTVFYTVSGTASNGVDYVLLTNALVFSEGERTVYVDVTPLADSILEGTETVTVTLAPTNTYVIDTNDFTQTVNIVDSSTTISIEASTPDAIETNSALGVGQVGIFTVFRSDTRGGGDYPPMTVNYQISGTASNGVDYQTLSGTVTFADGASSTNIFVQTLPDNLIEGDETVTLTLIPNGSAYYILQNESNATVTIHDSVGFSTVASDLNGAVGIDYYASSNSLLVSYNYNGGGYPFSLGRIYTNIVVNGGVPATNTVVTNWSGISGLQDEVYLASVKASSGLITNSSGFTNGDVFFGSGTGIGWLSAGATRSNLDWCILTNSVVTNALLLRGGICMDQTGAFSNQLVVVASPSEVGLGLKGVWRIDSHAQPTLVAQIDTEHLEGVTTLTNDAQKWGPWAGKIITGDEAHRNPDTGESDPLIYLVSTNVTAVETKTLFANGIYPEDFDVIPPNQNLYITAFNNNSVMELPASYFTNYVGDLLITDAGEAAPAGLYVVRWDAQGSNFVTTSIPVPDSVGGHIEGVTFAPIQLSDH